MCDNRCRTAKGDLCTCDCGGANHGISRAMHEDGLWDITLTFQEAEFFRVQFNRGNNCGCGFKGMHDLEIRGYKNDYGWVIRNQRYWLYVHCPKCGYDLNLSKMGALREPSLDEFNELITEVK